jgi:hypothetical protein
MTSDFATTALKGSPEATGSDSHIVEGLNILPQSIRERTDKAEFSPVVDWEVKHLQADKLNSLFQKSALSELGIILTDKLQQFLQEYRQKSVCREGLETGNL